MKHKNIIRVICASLIFVVIFTLLGKIFEPKWNYYGNQAQTRIQAFYEQEKDSMDVIYLGASFTYCGISPLTIYKEQGITGYDLCNPAQRAWISKAYLEDAFKTQSPKVVVYEVGPIFEEDESDEGHNRKNIDYMKWSTNKLEAIKEIVDHTTDESWKDYLFPFLRFHSRWNDLTETDFHLGVDKDYYFMGTALKMSKKAASDSAIADYEAFETSEDKGEVKVGERVTKAIQEMKAMCEEHGAKLQLVRMSSMEWSKNESDAVKAFAEENDLPFLDMNDPSVQKDVGIDWKTDSHDAGAHVNILGCEKTSSYLGKYLAENYDFDTEHSKDLSSFWDTSAEKFSNLIMAYSLSNEDKLVEYLNKSTDKDLVTLISLHGKIGDGISDETRAAIEKMGLHLPENGSSDAYLAVVKGNGDGTFTIEKEKTGKDVEKLVDYSYEGATLTMKSMTSGTIENKIKVDGTQYSLNLNGLNIASFDRTLGQVTDAVAFDTSSSELTASRTNDMLVKDEGGE